ncbi:Uncharacterised protein [Mycobacteroides abscessus subsp. abscessus]|nr:Uncharacterised protein [Mycobacteroides abscessus subsp. abscessus]
MAQRVLAQGRGNRLACRAFPHGGEQTLLLVGVRIEDERFLDREVLEQGGRGHVCGVGNLADADIVVAPLEEQTQRGVGDRPAGGRLLAFTAAHRRGCRLGVGHAVNVRLSCSASKVQPLHF